MAKINQDKKALALQNEIYFGSSSKELEFLIEEYGARKARRLIRQANTTDTLSDIIELADKF